ncbi:hypothetical protein RCO48_02630 [Peribacillus frigoritolerans]|nr:hypothetical protein [Peribacillus frigoritolerans]
MPQLDWGLEVFFLSLISQSDAFLAFSVIGMVFYFISIFDLVVTSLRNPKSEEDVEGMANQPEAERFYVIILSFVPGLGHFQLGLMNRGLIFLISFFRPWHHGDIHQCDDTNGRPVNIHGTIACYLDLQLFLILFNS